ncbi:hypothetical protein Dimus_004266, partial [Dionaea muscipula]
MLVGFTIAALADSVTIMLIGLVVLAELLVHVACRARCSRGRPSSPCTELLWS